MSHARTDRWADLQVRVTSALFMVIVGGVALWQGGTIFHIVVAVLAGVMLWELTRMIAPGRIKTPILVGLAGVALELVILEVPQVARPVLVACLVAAGVAVVWAVSRQSRHMQVALPYAVGILIAAYGLVMVRDNLGFGWIFWLVSIVIATDISGYFAGRVIGGPKFWPAISPKKTWSGTVAGWVASAFVGAVFAIGSGQMGAIVAMSVVISMASQAGDICESAIKRRCGVKDSSALIPGHGGLLDRFDGLLAAALLLVLLSWVTGMPRGLA